jgi:hypothetical protein
MTATLFSVADLIEDFSLYPRHRVDEFHVNEIVHAIEGGTEMPPIVACRRTKRIVEGFHRRHAYLKLGIDKAEVEFREYRNDSEHWQDAVTLQPKGLNFTPHDELRIMQISMEKFQLPEEFIAQMLKTSVSHLRKIKPRFANVREAEKARPELRRKPASRPEKRKPAERIPLKGSTRHLSGRNITRKQANAMERAPGLPYLALVNQLIDGIQNDLLPGPDINPILWERLEELVTEIHNVKAVK